MDTAMSEEKLRETFDRITREVTKASTGIRLVEGGSGPGKERCTVHIGFHQGFHSSLSFRADRRLLTRLSQAILQTEEISPQDLEDVTKEYLNVLCGHIAQVMYQVTRVVSRFDVPSFYRGDFSPEGQKEQFVLNYTDDWRDAAQLVHYIPDRAPPASPGGRSFS